MAEHRRPRRGHRIEPARIQYGAWDDPGASLFATVPQEPVKDMLTRLRRVPPGSRNHFAEMDACPLVLAPSKEGNQLYGEVKFQVQQLADERNKHAHSMQQQQRQTELIASMMAEQSRQQLLEERRRVQLHSNSKRLQELREEINRAKTTLSVLQKRNENKEAYGAEREALNKEAQEERERVRLEKLAEERALQEKAQNYSEQLVDQIRKLQADRALQEQAAREEGRQKRYNDEVSYANEQKQSLELRTKKREELKHMLDEFSGLQRNFREAHAEKADKLDVILMEAMSPVTKNSIRQELQQRQNEIERRRLVSVGLGQRLTEMRNKKDAHDKMLAEILICERQMQEKKRANQDIQKRYDQKQQVALDLIGQQKEQQMNRERDEALTATITITPTSFMERQYQQTSEREAAFKDITTKTYEHIAADAVHNAEVRAALIEEERKMRQALKDMEADLERRIDEERMRVLQAQSPEVINELRPCKLTKVERKTFNLPPCSVNHEDTHTK